MEEKDFTRYDKVVNRIKNNKLSVIILLLIAVVTGISSLFNSVHDNFQIFNCSGKTVPSVDSSNLAIKDTIPPKIYIPDSTNKNPELTPVKQTTKETTKEEKTVFYKLSVMTEPNNAKIYIDWEFEGITNKTLELKKGNYYIRIVNPTCK